MLRPRNLQREETFRTLKSLIIETVKIVYMFIYEFLLSQTPVRESRKKNLNTGCLGWMEAYGMSPALSSEQIDSTNQLAFA